MTIGSFDMEEGEASTLWVPSSYIVVSCLSHFRHQPAGSRDEVSTCTLRKHLIVFVEGTDGGLEKIP